MVVRNVTARLFFSLVLFIICAVGGRTNSITRNRIDFIPTSTNVITLCIARRSNALTGRINSITHSITITNRITADVLCSCQKIGQTE